MNVLSNMQGKEWGGCECHELVAMHHGSHLEGTFPATVLDGVGLFFRKKCMQELIEKTTCLDPNVRAPHHWYDRIITLNAVQLGWHVSIIGVGFDHYNGATANHSDKYQKLGEKWLKEHGKYVEGKAIDQTIYDVGLEQFTAEWAHRLPAVVNINHEVNWRA
jgi:hypothetical protein